MNAKFIYQKLKTEIKKLEEIIKKLKEENLEVFALKTNINVLNNEKASLKSQIEVNTREIKTLRDQHSGNALKRMSKELGETLAENIRLKNIVDDNEETIRDLREKLNKNIPQLEETPKNKNGEGRFSLLEI
jgi:chromosome segregation ATPase